MNRRLSASRLNDFLVCAHHAALWLDGVPAPATEDAYLDLVRAKCFEHKARALGALEKQYGPAVYIPTTGPMDGRLAVTLTAIRNDAPLIYQAAFDNGRWVGLPDFLVRKASPAGGWVYVLEDAKLAHRAKADHVIQLGIYATLPYLSHLSFSDFHAFQSENPTLTRQRYERYGLFALNNRSRSIA